MGVFVIDMSAAAAAISALYLIDQTFDPEGMLAPRDSALLALACFGLGFSIRGIFTLVRTWLFTKGSLFF